MIPHAELIQRANELSMPQLLFWCIGRRPYLLTGPAQCMPDIAEIGGVKDRGRVQLRHRSEIAITDQKTHLVRRSLEPFHRMQHG